MHHRSGRRLVALVVAALCVAAVAVPSAIASDQLVNKLTVGAVLVNQPKGQSWTIKLHLKADLIDQVDEVELPQSTNYAFTFPKAKLNASKFPVCKATKADFIAKHAAACPSSTQVGSGKGTAYGIGILFDNVPINIFNGPGTDSNRTVLVYSRLLKGGIDVDVPIVGNIKKTGNGFNANFPIPDIQLSDNEFASVQGFDTLIYKTIKKKGKTYSYLEAPTACSDPGFKFSFTATFKTGKQVSDTKTIPCEIPGV
jgi:hypothetical protein